MDSVVAAVRNRNFGEILTGMDNVIIPRVEVAVRSITVSSVHVRNSVVQNTNR